MKDIVYIVLQTSPDKTLTKDCYGDVFCTNNYELAVRQKAHLESVSKLVPNMAVCKFKIYQMVD